MDGLALFTYGNYKSFLQDWIKRHRTQNRGIQNQVAKAIKVAPPYISAVLNKDAQLSLEQGLRFARFAGFSNEEVTYFLLLIEYARADTADLRSFFKEQLLAQRSQNLDLSRRVKTKIEMKEIDLDYYFSDWRYAAIHLLLTTGEKLDVASLCKRFGVSVVRINSIIEFLVESKLIRRTTKGYQVGNARIHINSDSKQIKSHHVNWRVRALNNILGGANKADFHYSSVVSLSRDDFAKIKSMLIEKISETNAIVEKSDPEAIYVFSMDFFEEGKFE